MKVSDKNKMDNIQSVFRLVVKFRDHLNLPYHDAAEINHFFSRADWLPVKQLQRNFPGLRVDKLFTSLRPGRITELSLSAENLDGNHQAPDLLSYYILDCSYKNYSDEILQILRSHEEIELAYVETGPSFPPSSLDVSGQFEIHQGYLRSAPVGIDAACAWSYRGGDGAGRVKFIDIEQGWNTDSRNAFAKTLSCSGLNFPEFKDHGEKVLGVILKQPDSTGGRGIAPGANAYIVSQWRPDGNFNTADAILAAISELESGDIILLEAQVFEFPDMNCLWPVEIQPAIFETIRLATARGVTVIEAGGNGRNCFGEGNDLDHFTDDQGRNTLDPNSPGFKDSGAILVAAGTDSLPHKRIRYSNFGSRMDCYAWGERVSTGGSHLGPSDIAIESYRNKISGTSSAAAIIAGAAILVQSITESNYGFRLNPKQMRQILSDDLLGTPSANGRSADRIGSMPDLKKIIEYIHKNHHELKISKDGFPDSNLKSNTFSSAIG
jgi:hypothetical protein